MGISFIIVSMGQGAEEKAAGEKMDTTILTMAIILGSLFISIFILIIWFIIKSRKKPGHGSEEECEAQKGCLVNKNIKKTGNESFIQVDGLFSNPTLSSPDTVSTSSDSSLSLSNSSSVSQSLNSNAVEEKETNSEEMENSANVIGSCLHKENVTEGIHDSITQEDETIERKYINDNDDVFRIEAEVVSNKILVSTPLRRQLSFSCQEITETPILSDKKENENILQTSPLDGSHNVIREMSIPHNSELMEKVFTETIVTDNDIVTHEDVEALSKDNDKYDVNQSPSICEVGAECDSKIFQSSVMEISHHDNCYAQLFRNNHLFLPVLVRIFMKKYGNTL